MGLMNQGRWSLPANPLFKAFFYRSGTTTKVSAYTSSALSTPLDNPLSADANGLLASVYLDPATAYKLVLAPSTDTDPPANPILTIDPYSQVADQALAVLSKVANYTVATTDGEDVLILVDATLGAVTIAPYTAAGNTGRKIRVMKTDVSVNTVTVDPSGTQTINGASTEVLRVQYAVTNIVSDGSNWLRFVQQVPTTYPMVCEGRLTGTSGTAVTTSDVTGATSIYWTPCGGNRMALYDGSANWNIRTFPEIPIALAGFTASKNYDFYAYDNNGTVTIESVVWTNDTTRATAIALQDGVPVKSGSPTRRFLGTVYINSSGGQTDDSYAKRNISNVYNPKPRPMRVAAGSSYTYTTATYRQAGAAAANQLEFTLCLDERMLEASVEALFSNSSTGVYAAVSIGLDSTSAGATGVQAAGGVSQVANLAVVTFASLRTLPLAGRHTAVWLEGSTASGTTTWFGNNGTPSTTPGITGSVWG